MNKPVEMIFDWKDIVSQFCFVFKYQKRGQDMNVRADVLSEAEDVFIAISNHPIEEECPPEEYTRLDVGLTPEMLDGCRDCDDIGVAIAKLVVKDNDGEVLMSVYDPWNASPFSQDIRLDEQLCFVKDEECPYTLTLYANCGRTPEDFTIYEFDDDEFADEISEYFDDEDADGLNEVLFEMDDEVFEVFNLWGDETEEKVSYEIANEDGDIVEEGEFEIHESNVFPVESGNKHFNENHHPKYVVLHRDSMKHSCAIFNVPVSFKMQDCHFSDSNFLDNRIISCDWMGDTVTSLTGVIRCHGMEFIGDADDAGSYGSSDFILYRYNEEEGRYEELASME